LLGAKIPSEPDYILAQGRARSAEQHRKEIKMLANRSFYLLIVAILVLTACTPQAAATSIPASALASTSVPPVTEAPTADNQVWSQGLPPNGVWQVELTTDDFVRMGLPVSTATEMVGIYSWKFEDGKAQTDFHGTDPYSCTADYLVVEDFVRFTYTTGRDCAGEVDDLQWRLEDDGLHLHLVAIKSAPFLKNKAYLEAKPWQKIAGPMVQVDLVPVISIQPSEAYIDEPVSIRLSGFEPNHEVTIRATTVGTAFPDRIDTGIVRESQATFQTDANGEVDLEKQAPLSGSYEIADGMGLFWSMEENPAKARSASSDPAPTLQNAVQYRYKFTAEVDGEEIAEATVIQNMGSDSVVATEVAEIGVVGQFYRPGGAGPFPAVITLGGSGGGLLRQSPKVLAAHGYAVLSLAYFNYTSPVDNTSLPDELYMIPVEYFGKAIEWLQSQPGVDPERIGLIGSSIGGTVALQVGAIYPQAKTVIVFGSPTVMDGQELSYQGQALPSEIPIEKSMVPYCSFPEIRTLSWTA
jgi:hypothetical protein